jgi:opacity protein-like surface antigen
MKNTLLPASWARASALLATILCTALAAPPAFAEGLYVGASLGQTRFSANGDADSTSGSKFFAGVQLAPGWSAELGFVPLDSVSYPDSGSTVRVKAHSVYLDAVGSWRVDEGIWLLGRVGVASSTVKASVSTPSSWSSASLSDTGLKYGFGASYTLTPHWAARAEWEQYQWRDNSMSLKARALTVGLSYQF